MKHNYGWSVDSDLALIVNLIWSRPLCSHLCSHEDRNIKCRWMRWQDKKASVFQHGVARTQVSPSSSWSFRSTQPLSPTMHHKRVSQWSSTCFLYLQDRIPDILVAFAWCWADRQQIPPAWKPPRRYKVPMVLTGEDGGQVPAFSGHQVCMFCTKLLLIISQIVIWCLIVTSVCVWLLTVQSTTASAVSQAKLSEHIMSPQQERCCEKASKTSL